MSQEVGNKQKSTSPGLVRQPPNLDAVVDGKFPDDMDSASIFSKVIGEKLSYGSFGGLYMSCRMSFAADPVQTKTSEFMDLGFSTINALYEGSGISTPTTIIQKPMDGAHWSRSNHVFGETKAVGMSEAKSD